VRANTANFGSSGLAAIRLSQVFHRFFRGAHAPRVPLTAPRRNVFSGVGHRCGDALISADERSDVGARVRQARTSPQACTRAFPHSVARADAARVGEAPTGTHEGACAPHFLLHTYAYGVCHCREQSQCYAAGKSTMNHMRGFTIVASALCFWLAIADEEKKAQTMTIPAEWSDKVTDTAQLPVEKNSWGTLQWLCNGKLSPGAAQTVGIATILPGQRNPVHFHPNCEEVLHVLSGRGLQSYDGRAIELKAGMTIRIPAGVKHNMVNTGPETLKALISFSNGDRQTVFLEAPPAK